MSYKEATENFQTAQTTFL